MPAETPLRECYRRGVTQGQDRLRTRRAADADVHDRRADRIDDMDDGARIGVEQLLVGGGVGGGRGAA
jgi:hypothetical protein